MKKIILFTALCIFCAYLIPRETQPCTTFCLDHDDDCVCGKNYDWMVSEGLVMVNKRKVAKTAIQGDQPELNPASWISKYGSVTFNQYGRELPMGGMNETGLVVESMMLEETQYPSPDSRPALFSLQWIQYQLDNFQTVPEVLAGFNTIRIRASGGPGVHFLVCDKNKNSAAIEFIDGKLVCHTQNDMPIKTLTNSPYAASISFWNRKTRPSVDNYGSIGRFVRAADLVKNYDRQTAASRVDYGFDILKDTSQMSTLWRIVYDQKDLIIYFRSAANFSTRRIDLKLLDFSCKTPVLVLDINGPLSGEVTSKLMDYTPQINRHLINNAFSKTPFLRDVPEERLDQLARYPASTVCAPCTTVQDK
jgi:penicillin V acylase-like amidase (Ntn superfamily)